MDVLDLFFKKYSYKFDKGYLDINNEQDVLLFESILSQEFNIEVSLEETALTPAELNKDATLSKGNKVPRINILIQKITNNEPLELNSGDTFIVTDKEKVLSQLKGKTKIDKAIILGANEDGKTITTSDLKKTADFGGGGGMRGGSELTSQAESAQCITNAIRYSSGEITTKDITDQAIENSKNKTEVTDFEAAVNLLKTNNSWLISSVSIANALATQFPGSFIHHRGSAWVQKLNNVVKPLLKNEGIKDLNKWNPADIWMVNPSEIEIEWPNTLAEINALLLKKFNDSLIIGVSLKKTGNEATLKVYNDQTSPKPEYEYEGMDIRPSHAKSYILLKDGSKIEFRNFSGLTGFQGELVLKKAAGGKVGYSIIKKAFADNDIALSDPNEIKTQVEKNDPDFKSKFKKLWNSFPELASEDFNSYYDNSNKTLNQNESYRISKFLALEIANAILKTDKPNKIISDIIGYASSQTNVSSVFVKAF